MIKGYVTGNVNIRNKTDLLSTTIVGSISANGTFEGSGLVLDALGKKWIKLTKVNGVPVVEPRYIAAYITSVQYNEYPDETTPPSEDLGVPEKITTVEEFKLSDGSLKKRTIVWINPQVTEA